MENWTDELEIGDVLRYPNNINRKETGEYKIFVIDNQQLLDNIKKYEKDNHHNMRVLNKDITYTYPERDKEKEKYYKELHKERERLVLKYRGFYLDADEKSKINQRIEEINKQLKL